MSTTTKKSEKAETKPKRLLEATGLNAAYAGYDGRETKAVDNVSVHIDEGEILGVAGESGCGKSTLGSVLSLTVRPPLFVQSGTLVVDGQTQQLGEQHKVPRTWRGEVVSMLPQGALNSLSNTMRIRSLVWDVMKAHHPNMKKDEALDRARDRMKELGLPPRAIDSYPFELSGGMKQRVITVISTLLNPRLLIADEPTSALDVSSQRALVELLREMLNQGIMAGVIFITHDLPLLKSISDRVAVMYAGQVIEVAAAEDIADRPRHPYSAALLNAVLAPEPKTLSTRVEAIHGSPPSLAAPPPGCRFHPRCGLVMPVCKTEVPPRLGDELVFSYCHWTQQHPDSPINIQDVLSANSRIDAAEHSRLATTVAEGDISSDSAAEAATAESDALLGRPTEPDTQAVGVVGEARATPGGAQNERQADKGGPL